MTNKIPATSLADFNKDSATNYRDAAADMPAAMSKHSEDADQFSPGEKVHLGLASKGGAGFRGTLEKIEGGTAHVKSSEEGKFGSKTYKGPEKNLSKDMSLSDFNKDSEQSFGPGKPAEQDMIGTAIIVDGTKDHWIVSKRIGKYQVLEGAGVNGGEWAAKGPGDFEKFKTKAQAIEHSEVSQSNENWPD